MSAITTHVLDTASGTPAAGLRITLERSEEGGQAWHTLADKRTDADGRVQDLLPSDQVLVPGTYRMTFDTGGYFEQRGVDGFYPEAVVCFSIRDGSQHYHVPLLLSPFGYSTYRGS